MAAFRGISAPVNGPRPRARGCSAWRCRPPSRCAAAREERGRTSRSRPGHEVRHVMTGPPLEPSDKDYDPLADQEWRLVRRTPPGCRTTRPSGCVSGSRSTGWAASTGTWTAGSCTWTRPPSRCSTCAPRSTTAARVPRSAGAAREEAAAGRHGLRRPSRTAATATARTSGSAAATARCAGPTPRGCVRRDADGPARAAIIGIVRDADRGAGRLRARGSRPTRSGRRQTSMVESTTAALAHARTVQDVIDVLKDSQRPRAARRDRPGHGRWSRPAASSSSPRARRAAFVPGTRYTRVDEQYPMSEVVRTLGRPASSEPGGLRRRYPRAVAAHRRADLGRAAYLPLIAQARPIGALGLLYARAAASAPEERNCWWRSAAVVAQSLQRAMLFEQEQELADGAAAGDAAAPDPRASRAARSPSATAPARIGRDIGGDWYDVIALPGGRVGAVIGDVQGHDTHAAAVMGQLRIVLRAYAGEGHTPATVLARASALPRRAGHRALRDLHVRRGRPGDRGGAARSGPAISTR